MPPLSAKNLMSSPAVTDLGLGDMLRQQLDATLEERRKKLLQQQQGATSGFGATGVATSMQSALSPASTMLFGGISKG